MIKVVFMPGDAPAIGKNEVRVEDGVVYVDGEQHGIIAGTVKVLIEQGTAVSQHPLVVKMTKEDFVKKLLSVPRDLDGVKLLEYNDPDMSDEQLHALSYDKYLRGALSL